MDAIKKKELKWNPEIVKHSWNPDFSDPTVDAGRESRERRANVLQGLDTFTGYFADNGEDYVNRQLPLRGTEIDAQCALAEVLCEKHPKLSFETALARIATSHAQRERDAR